MSKKLMVAIATAALAATSLTAHAADFSVSVANTTNLDPAAAVLKVTINNIPDGKGIYLQVCENTATAGESCNAARGASKWFSTAATSAQMGATVVEATSEQEFTIPASFTNAAGEVVTCTAEVNKCGLYVRGDHLNATDETLKKFIPVSFSGAKAKVAAMIGFTSDRVAVRVWGAKGETLKVKIGGRWVTREITSNSQLVTWKVGSKDVSVAAYVGKSMVASK